MKVAYCICTYPVAEHLNGVKCPGSGPVTYTERPDPVETPPPEAEAVVRAAEAMFEPPMPFHRLTSLYVTVCAYRAKYPRTDT